MTLLSRMRHVSKRTWAAVATLAAITLVPASLLAWGPSRPTYTMESPADHITFNSITNATNYGDERNFVTISPDNSTYSDDITVANGQEYYVRIYVHNNAASNLNLVAHNVVAKLNVPSQTADRIQIDGYVNSPDAQPTSVWDQAVFHGANGTQFKLSYVSGSAYYKNAKGQFAIADSVASSGASLGYDKMDGNIPGCFQYSGVLYLKVKAQTSDFTVSKTVRKNGTTTFGENVTVNPGDKVDYQLYYKNTGGLNQTNVTIKDVLPAGMSYVPNTTYVHDDKGTRQVADGITTGGMTMGSYAPNGDVYIKFTAQAAANDKLPTCGTNTLVNTMQAISAETATKSDTASVTVVRDCPTPPTHPAVTIAKTVNGKETVQVKVNEQFEYTIVVTNTGDVALVNAKVSDTAPAGITFVSTDKGTVANNVLTDTITLQPKGTATYHVKAVAKAYIAKPAVNTACVDAAEISGTKDACDDASTTMVEEPTPVKVTACNLDTFKIEQIDKSKIDNKHYTTDLTKCREDVCRLSDKTIITITKSDFDSKKYSRRLVDCDTITPGPTPTPTPTPAAELPHTGVASDVFNVIGLGSLVGITSAYIASRRAAGQN